MSTYSIHEVIQSTDRYKLYTLLCNVEELPACIDFIKTHKINVVNIGLELANFINTLEDYRYLNIDVYDYTQRLLDEQKTRINNQGNDVIAVYNLGILMEPALELNAVQLLKEFSKSAALIIIWENLFDIPDRLHWPTQQNNIFIDFIDAPIKKLQYAL